MHNCTNIYDSKCCTFYAIDCIKKEKNGKIVVCKFGSFSLQNIIFAVDYCAARIQIFSG